MFPYQIPAGLKSCLKILFTGSVDDVSDYLPIELSRIKEISEKCKSSSKEVVKKFEEVMKTMDQICEATLVKQGKVQDAKTRAEARLKREKEEKEFYENQLKDEKECLEKMKKELEEGNAQYKKAFDEMPGVGAMVGLGLAETAIKVAPILAVAGAGSMLLGVGTAAELSSVAIAAGAAYMSKNLNDSPKSGTPIAEEKAEDAVVQLKPRMNDCDGKLYRYAKDLSTRIGAGMEAIFQPSNGKAMNFVLAHAPEDNKEGSSIKDLNAEVEALSDKIEETQRYANEKLFTKVRNYIGGMKKILLRLESIDSEEKEAKEEVEELKKEFKELVGKVEKLKIEQKARSGSNTLERPGPGMRDKLMGMCEETKLTENSLKNAHLKVECSREQLRSSEERLENALKKFRETQKAKLDTERKMEEYNLQTTELPQVLKMITEGLQKMGELKQEWSKLLEFFTRISNTIETATGPAMKSFEDWTRKTGENRLKRGDNFKPSDMVKQQIWEITKEAGKTAFVVNRIAGCYSTISRKHLMPLVARLNSMIAMDRDKDAAKIEEEKRALQAASVSARQIIDEITMENISRARSTLQGRMKELDNLVETCIPALPEPDRVSIQQEAKQITMGEVATELEIDLDDF